MKGKNSHNEGEFIAGLLNPDASEMSKQKLSVPGPHMVCKPLDNSWESGWPYGVVRVPSHSVDSVLCGGSGKKETALLEDCECCGRRGKWVLWKKISLASPRPHHLSDLQNDLPRAERPETNVFSKHRIPQRLRTWWPSEWSHDYLE